MHSKYATSGEYPLLTNVSNPDLINSITPPLKIACSPNKSVSVSSRKLVSIIPAGPPPFAIAYDNAVSYAVIDTF